MMEPEQQDECQRTEQVTRTPDGRELENVRERTGQPYLLSRSPGMLARSRPTFLDIAFGLVLFLTMTDLYRFIASWGGLKGFGPIAGVFTLVSIVYTLRYRWYARVPLSRWTGWTAFLLLVPLWSLVYSLNPNFRDVALQFLSFSLLWASKAFFTRDATKRLRCVLLDAGLVSGFAGVVLSIFKPSLFTAIAEITDSTTYSAGRGYGFYLQPNVCAASLTLLFLLWLFMRKSTGMHRVVFTGGYLLSIFLTGSRGGMIMSVCLISLHALLRGAGWDFSRLSIRFIRLALFGGMGLALLIAVIFEIAPYFIPYQGFVTLTRIRNLAELHSLAADDAMGSRLEHQRAYFSFITERPFLGYGLGSPAAMRESKLLKKASHNTFIEYTFMYGIVGLGVWAGVIWMTWRDCASLRRVEHLKIDLLFFVILFLACMVSNTVLGNRILYIVLGWILARRYSSYSAPLLYVRASDPDGAPAGAVITRDCFIEQVGTACFPSQP